MSARTAGTKGSSPWKKSERPTPRTFQFQDTVRILVISASKTSERNCLALTDAAAESCRLRLSFSASITICRAAVDNGNASSSHSLNNRYPKMLVFSTVNIRHSSTENAPHLSQRRENKRHIFRRALLKLVIVS